MAEKIHIIRAEKAFEFKHSVPHLWNPDSIVPGTQLDRLVGLERTRITVVRIAAGSHFEGVDCAADLRADAAAADPS